MISLCITTYNRTDFLAESFRDVLSDDRVPEIIISDDHSHPDIYERTKAFCSSFPKVKLYRNGFTFGMAGNKRHAISLATEEFASIFDDDNKMDHRYLDAIAKVHLTPKTIYCPSFAEPTFDYRKYEGMTVNRDNVKDYMGDPMFRCAMNTCNYVVNRGEYFNVYEYDKTIKGTDTIAFNYRWLLAGNSFFFVPGMYYFHRVHEGSGFMADVNYNMAKAKEYEEKLRAL